MHYKSLNYTVFTKIRALLFHYITTRKMNEFERKFQLL